MGLIGLHQSLGGRHLTEFAAALYDEVVSQWPAGAEIDIAVATRDTDIEDDVPMGFVVVDYLVTRVDGEVFVGGDKAIGGHIPSYAKGVDEWARSVEGADGYFFAHVHEEGNVHASPKDMMINMNLSSVDYVRGEANEDGNQLRYYTFMSIMNRDQSRPLQPSSFPIPIGDREIDLGLIRKVMDTTIQRHNLDDDHPMVQNYHRIEGLLTARFDARDAGDEIEVERISGELQPLLERQQQYAEDLMRQNMPPEIAEMMDEIAGLLEGKFGVPVLDRTDTSIAFDMSGVDAKPSDEAFPPLDRPTTKDEIKKALDDIVSDLVEESRDRPEVPDAFKDLPDIQWLD